ncbi:IS66 family insertion sequence element accessory protein TnpB (plasmid) [Mesorhizobium sp. AR07]|uniref:IS66 family insertion sequence element accessory protein TnpB n=1 Tax=Mesorhizobium sp. AR07 TaxID=2865838 RepID=UPI0021FC801D|nr:IS66 family insertion sequence element accessory protein TnpB [Mesorhizobium sp. AR07]UVK48122.1 IS66 family insertion sequence element accessory protein TnpB [Mesorhizobium sp. AR07]
MIPTEGVRVWLATGYTDMRCGFPSLALRVQEVLKHNPLGGNLFCFRGKRGNLLKVIWHDGQGVRIRRRPHDWHARACAAGSMMALREGQAVC